MKFADIKKPQTRPAPLRNSTNGVPTITWFPRFGRARPAYMRQSGKIVVSSGNYRGTLKPVFGLGWLGIYKLTWVYHD